MSRLDEIMRLAEEATHQHWRLGRMNHIRDYGSVRESVGPTDVVVDTDIGPYVLVAGNNNFYEDAKRNCAFIATMNPQTVKQMVELIRMQHECLIDERYVSRYSHIEEAIAAFEKFEKGEG